MSLQWTHRLVKLRREEHNNCVERWRRRDNRVGNQGNQVWKFENEKKKIVKNESEGAVNGEKETQFEV